MIYKKSVFFIVVSLFLFMTSIAIAKEITLYDSSGEATAYIDTEDENNIYLWGGKPVAYLNHNSIYGFNGKHLGWIEDGILYDHDDIPVGFTKESTNIATLPEHGYLINDNNELAQHVRRIICTNLLQQDHNKHLSYVYTIHIVVDLA